jgi:hypothetical protein
MCRSKLGSELIFISKINRDGKSLEILCKTPKSELGTVFKITPLSLSSETFIASEFNSYIVKIKP